MDKLAREQGTTDAKSTRETTPGKPAIFTNHPTALTGPSLIRPLRDSGLVSLTILVSAALCVTILYLRASRSIKEETRNSLVRTALTISAALDGDLHQTLTAPEQESGNEYLRAVEPLRRFQAVRPDIRFIYTMVLRDDGVHIVLDATPPGDADLDGVEDHSPLMERYEPVTPALMTALRTGTPQAEPAMVKDRWGEYLSGYAPFYDSHGRRVGVVGVDMRLDRFQARFAALRRALLACGLLALLLSGLGGIGVFFQRRTALIRQQEIQVKDLALRESEQRYRILAESAQDAIFILDRDQRLQYANAFAARQFDLEPQDLVGKTIQDLFGPEFAKQQAATMARIFASGRPVHEEAKLPFPTGETWLSTWLTPILDEEGNINLVMGVARDITERKQTEDQLRLQNAALASAANGIVITDTQGVIIWANQAFSTLTGYRLDEVVGQHTRLLKSGRQLPSFYQHLWNTIKDGDVWRGTLVNRRKNGELYTEDMTVTPVRNSRGEVAHFVAIKHDISERLLLENQLVQSQKMESIGRLAGGVAHDFNNLVQAISGFSEILLSDLEDDDPRRQDVQEIEKAAHRAAELTRQLLAFSRKQMIEPRVFNLNGLVEGTRDMLRRLIGEDIEIVTHLEPALHRVKVDPGQLEQVLMNLAVNARDAMPEGGRLTISTLNITLQPGDSSTIPESPQGTCVCLAIADTGAGMRREVQEHIFEPFFSTKDPGKGTGLGLAVVYGIVKQHEGFIHVYSQLGQGSTFKIYLPAFSLLEDKAVPIAEPVSTRHFKGKGARILVVEDEDGVRGLTCRILRSHDYLVIAATNGREALAAFEQEHGAFDLLFTDVVLPDRNGLEIAEALLVRKPNLRVLFTSGYTDERSRWPSIRDQGFRFIQKPYPAIDLLRTVQEILQT